MKTLRVLFTICLVLSVNFGFATVSGGGHSEGGPGGHSTDSDWAFELGMRFAEYGVEPLYALQVVVHMRTWNPYRNVDDNTPFIEDIGYEFWNGFKYMFRSMNPHDEIIVFGGSYDAQTSTSRYQALKGADLRGLDFIDVHFVLLDMTEVKFDGSLISGWLSSCVLDKSSWQNVTAERLTITWSSMKETNIDMRVPFGTLRITHTDISGCDLSSLLLGQQHVYGMQQDDESGLMLRSCDVTGANIPAAVYARASVMYCTGIVQADYEDGLRLANQTNTFITTPPAVPTPPIQIVPAHLTVEKNAEMSDGSSEHPTGIVNETSVKIASFVIIGGRSEPTQINQIVLRDISTTYYASRYFRNLRLMHDSSQLGTTISRPAFGAVVPQTHTFFIAPTVINAWERYVVDVYADILDQTITTATPVLQLFFVNGTGVVSGSSSSWSDANGLTLQRQYITPPLRLTLAWAPDSPQGLTATSEETIVAKVAISNPPNSGNYAISVFLINFSISAVGFDNDIERTLKIYQDMPGGTPLATYTWEAATVVNTEIAHADFTDFEIASGETKMIYATLDTTGARTGSRLSIAVWVSASNARTGTAVPIYGPPLEARTLEF